MRRKQYRIVRKRLEDACGIVLQPRGAIGLDRRSDRFLIISTQCSRLIVRTACGANPSDEQERDEGDEVSGKNSVSHRLHLLAHRLRLQAQGERHRSYSIYFGRPTHRGESTDEYYSCNSRFCRCPDRNSSYCNNSISVCPEDSEIRPADRTAPAGCSKSKRFSGHRCCCLACR